VQIALALTRAANAGIERIHFKIGTYDINNLTIATPVEITGEEGVVWDLPASPSLTITAAATLVTFDKIKFTSTFDGDGHVIIQNAETRFERCEYDLQLDTGDQDIGVFRNNPAAKNKVTYKDCIVIQVGKTGAGDFLFFKSSENMTHLIFDGFRIVEAITDVENGTCRFVSMDTDKYIDHLEMKHILWEHVNTDGGGFEYGRAYSVLVDDFVFMDGTWFDAGSHIIPFALNYGDMTINNLVCYDRVHPHGSLGQYSRTQVNNLYLEGDTSFQSPFDLPGANGSYPRFATFSNVNLLYGSLDINSGLAKVVISSGTLENSRIWIGDEDTGDEIDILISDLHWYYNGSDDFNYAIIINWDQGVDIANLIISDCIVENEDVFINMSGQPGIGQATHFIIDHVKTYPDKGAVLPIFINNTGRTDDLQRVWIFDSYITTDAPPLGDWNPIRDNDRFDNVVWWDIDDNAEVFSETAGKATIALGGNNVVVTHNLVSTPDYDPANDLFGIVLVTGTHAEVEACYVDTVGAATFTIHKGNIGAGNVTADRYVFWKASITDFAG